MTSMAVPDSIAALRAAYWRIDTTPTRVVDSVLGRVEHWEPRLNAFIAVLADQAYEQAAEADRAYAAGGWTPPLAGVPISVKDVVAVAGHRMTAGSRILRCDAERDATVYRRLRAAGAVVFATTNMLEFAYGFAHPDYGQTNNPWDACRTAGGSSGGSAASVAAGIGWGSVVTDTGGSARLPAAFCGVTGLKPTYGTIDRTGVLPLAPSLDVVGALTRGVEDARLLHRVLTADPMHPTGTRRTGSPPTRAVGVLDDLSESLTGEVRAAFDAALDTFRRAGVQIRRLRLPGVLADAGHAATIMLAEAAHTHEHWYPRRSADYAAGTAANLAAGHRVGAVDYLRARRAVDLFRGRVDALLEHVDVLACPTIGFTAPEREPDFAGGGLDYVARTIPFSASGHPALSVPAPTDPGGMPAAVELVGGHHRENDLFDLAAAYERALGGFPTVSPSAGSARTGSRTGP